MRPIFAGVLICAIALSGYFWWETAYSTCRVPIYYDIGDIDARFGLPRGEAERAISDAESLWEEATGRNLFTFKEGAPLLISFVFDERQKLTTEEKVLREELDEKAEVSQSLRSEYTKLVRSYNELRERYDAAVAAYDERLRIHNEEVASWNDQGGAPEEVYGELNERQEAFARESQSLNRTARELNALVRDINSISETGNLAVRDYNNYVEHYNSRFHEAREFTQGDFRGKSITIYQFDSPAELRLVLAHELGHALSLDHVNDPDAIMYHLMEGQLSSQALSEADLAEFSRVCGTF